MHCSTPLTVLINRKFIVSCFAFGLPLSRWRLFRVPNCAFFPFQSHDVFLFAFSVVATNFSTYFIVLFFDRAIIHFDTMSFMALFSRLSRSIHGFPVSASSVVFVLLVDPFCWNSLSFFSTPTLFGMLFW